MDEILETVFVPRRRKINFGDNYGLLLRTVFFVVFDIHCSKISSNPIEHEYNNVQFIVTCKQKKKKKIPRTISEMKYGQFIRGQHNIILVWLAKKY